MLSIQSKMAPLALLSSVFLLIARINRPFARHLLCFLHNTDKLSFRTMSNGDDYEDTKVAVGQRMEGRGNGK